MQDDGDEKRHCQTDSLLRSHQCRPDVTVQPTSQAYSQRGWVSLPIPHQPGPSILADPDYNLLIVWMTVNAVSLRRSQSSPAWARCCCLARVPSAWPEGVDQPPHSPSARSLHSCGAPQCHARASQTLLQCPPAHGKTGRSTRKAQTCSTMPIIMHVLHIHAHGQRRVSLPVAH